MLERLLDYLFERRRLRLRRDLARRILGLLEQRGAVLFNANTVEWLGAGRREAFLMVCYLAVRERLHLKTDSRDRMILLSNAEFERLVSGPPRLALTVSVAAQGENFLVAPAKRSRKNLRRLSGQRVMRVDLTADSLPLDDETPSGDATIMRPVLDEALAVANGEENTVDSAGWSTVIITPDETAGKDADLPDTARQSLPDRPREPWFSAEAMMRDVEKTK